MNTNKTLWLSLACISLFTCTSARAGNIEDGLMSFKAHRYYAAEEQFNKAIAEDPQNQTAYLWLGKTLQQLYDDKAAKNAFEQCFKIMPFSQTGMEAKQLMLSTAGKIQSDEHVPTDTVEQMTKTVQNINRQAGESKARYIKDGNAGAQYQLNMGNMYSWQKYGYNANMTLQNLRNPNFPGQQQPYTGIQPGMMVGQQPIAGIQPGMMNGMQPGFINGLPAYMQPGLNGGLPQTQAYQPNTNAGLPGIPAPYVQPQRPFTIGNRNQWTMSNTAAIDSSATRANAQVGALNYQIAGTTSATEIQKSANNLEYLLAEKKRPGEAKLRALGTDLFTRYYGTDDHKAPLPPSDPPIELKATELKLGEVQPLPKALTAVPQKL